MHQAADAAEADPLRTRAGATCSSWIDGARRSQGGLARRPEGEHVADRSVLNGHDAVERWVLKGLSSPARYRGLGRGIADSMDQFDRCPRAAGGKPTARRGRFARRCCAASATRLILGHAVERPRRRPPAGASRRRGLVVREVELRRAEVRELVHRSRGNWRVGISTISTTSSAKKTWRGYTESARPGSAASIVCTGLTRDGPGPHRAAHRRDAPHRADPLCPWRGG